MNDTEGSSDFSLADEDAPHLTESHNEDMSSSSDKEAHPYASFQFYQVPLRNRCNGDSDSDEDMQPPKLLKPPACKATAEELRGKGNDFARKKEHKKAIEKYKEAIKANPKDKVNIAKCNRNISICYSELEDFSPAVHYAVQAIEAQPTYDAAYVRCGKAYMEMGKPVMAALVYKKGLAILPRSEAIAKAMDELNQTNKTDVDRAEVYCKSKNRINLDILAVELEFKSKRNEKKELFEKRKNEEETATLPGLIESSCDDSDPEPSCNSDENIENDDDDSKPPKSFIPESPPGAKVRNANSKNSSILEPEVASLTVSEIDDSEEADDDVSTKTEFNKKKNKEKILAEQKKLNEKRQADERKEAKRKRDLEEKKENERKDRERKEIEAIQKREEEKKLRSQRVNSKQEIKQEFQKTCEEASMCLINMVPKSSMERYGDVLEMCSKHHSDLWPTTKYKNISHNEDVVVIKYMFAKACGQTNNYECILAGLNRLDEIRDDHAVVKFPTIFYGYSLIWAKLNRFDRAAEAVKEGIDFLNQGFNVTSHNWPGIPSKLIEETSKDILLEKLEALAVELKYPPRPDVVCRWEKCAQVQSSLHIVPSQKIYFSDPDYRGYYRVYCHSNCQVCYHKSCWMSVKGASIEKLKLAKSPTEKDFLGQSCFTPDCDAIVTKVEIIEDNGKLTTVQDIKMLEKIEAEERKCKEKSRIKREKEDGEKRLKMFENKQIKKKYEKCSSKKEKEENNNSKDSQYYFSSQPQNANKEKIPHHNYCKSQPEVLMAEGKDKKREKSNEKDVLDCKEFAHATSNDDNYKASKLESKQDSILCDINEQQNNNLNPYTLDFVPENKEEEHVKEKIFSYIVDVIRVNGPTKLDNDILWKGLDSSSKSFIFKKDFTLKDFLINNSTQFKVMEQKVYLTSHVNGIPLAQNHNITEEATKQNSASIITIQGKVQAKETNGTLSKKTEMVDSSRVSLKGAESLNALKPSLGDIARELKEKILRKSIKELPEKIPSTYDDKIDLGHVTNAGVDAALKGKEFFVGVVHTSVQTDVSGVHEGDLDTLALQQQNESLILELQETKDKIYKIQSERKLESKESNDKCMVMAEDNRKLKSENNEYQEQITKMKKAVSDSTKISNELKKTSEALNQSKTQLEETHTYLREERCQNLQLKSQLTLVSQEKDVECQTNAKLRLKLLEIEFRNYSDILRQRQVDNQRVINHLMESPELEHIPQVQIALSSLNEFSARLLVADEDLKSKYESLVRQSQGNKTLKELNFDLKSVEPPNLGSSCLNLLHSFIIMNQHSSRLSSAPFSFASVPPPPISRTSPSAQGLLPPLNSRDASRDLGVGPRSSPMPPPSFTVHPTTFPGIREADFRLPGPPPVPAVISSRSSASSQDSLQSATHAPTSLPTTTPTSYSTPTSPAPQVTQSKVNKNEHKKAFPSGSTAAHPPIGATAAHPPTAGATAFNSTCSRNTGAVKKSTTSFNGANHSADQPGNYTPGANHSTDQPRDNAPVKKGDYGLVSQLQKDHPSVSTQQGLDYVKELRKSNNGKLSGMSTKDILNKLEGFVQRDKGTDGGTDAEDINCSICLEDMFDVDSLYLNPCRHRFHTACINQWLNSPGGAGSTCPMCRNYIVKEEEFPNLRPARRFQ